MTTRDRKTRTRTRTRSRSRTKKSFTPKLNRYLDTAVTRTRRRDVFSCKDDHVKVKIRRSTGRRSQRKKKTMSNRRRRKTHRSKSKSKFYQCLPLGDSRTKNQLQRLLNRKRVSNCVTAPNQRLSNCWFNTMFMSFFVSDKGHKFTKVLRQIMIHGKRVNGSMLDEKMKMPFMQLNAAIQASIDCTDEKRYLLDNTNIIIEKIARDLPNEYRHHTIFRPREAGGPLEYYQTIINYLLQPTPHENPFVLLKGVNFMTLLTNPANLNLMEHGKERNEPPDIIVGEIFGEIIATTPNVKKPLRFRLNRKYEYKLDSVILANEEHYISFHMIKGKQMGFDGASRSRLTPFQWRDLINTDKAFNLYKDKRSVKTWNFNFTKNQQFLIYFRSK